MCHLIKFSKTGETREYVVEFMREMLLDMGGGHVHIKLLENNGKNKRIMEGLQF